MSTDPIIPGADDLVDALRTRLEEQPWYHRFSNTVTSAAGGLVLLMWVALAAGIDIPTSWTGGISGVIAVLTTLGVLQTRNGLTPRGIDDIEQVVTTGRHRRE